MKYSGSNRFAQWTGEASIVLGVLAVIPSLISGIGISMALFALLLSSLSAVTGTIKYALIMIFITTANIFGVSVLSKEWGRLDEAQVDRYILFIGSPYIIVLFCVCVGMFWHKNKAD